MALDLALMAGCNPKKNTVKATTATISGVEVGSQCLGTSTNKYGTVFDTSNMSYDFTNRVKALLSVNIKPEEIGLVSGAQADPTGVRFSGSVKLDSTGNVISDQSKVTISVYDSVWLNNRYTNPNEQEIKIEFDPKAGRGATISGQFNTSSGTGILILHDNYGEIRFNGQIDAQRMSGTVSFQNSTNVSGGAALSGTLGQFYIERCAFLQ